MSFAVIIPSRNAANLLPCVAAVRKHEPDARIIVVDDGLGHEVRDKLSAEHKFGRVERLVSINGEDPFIFARNVNIGIDYAAHKKYCARGLSGGHYPCSEDCQLDDDVVILNDDALLETPGGFSLMAKAAQEHPEYGIIASTCNNVGNRNQWRLEGGGLYGSGIRGGVLDGLRDEPRMVCFVAVLIPRRTIETVGLLDERYTGYGCDDDDYSFSVRKAGLKIGIHDGCYVDHGSLTSSFRGAAGSGGDYRPNLRRFIEKWGVDNWGKDWAHSDFPDLFPAQTTTA